MQKYDFQMKTKNITFDDQTKILYSNLATTFQVWLRSSRDWVTQIVLELQQLLNVWW